MRLHKGRPLQTEEVPGMQRTDCFRQERTVTKRDQAPALQAAMQDKDKGPANLAGPFFSFCAETVG